MKIYIVTGPTGTGKTDYATKFAKLHNCELINCDSVQFYKELSIWSNKGEISLNKNGIYEIDKIPIHLISFLDLNQYYSIYQYKIDCYKKFEEIWNRKKNVIIVGGSGLFIDAIVKNYQITENSVDLKFREKLNLKTLDQLTKILIQKNKNVFQNLNHSDSKNKLRLIRLIEKEMLRKNSKEKILNDFVLQKNFLDIDFEIFYPIYNVEKVKIKLKLRLEQNFDNLVKECRKILQKYPDFIYIKALNSLGYNYLIQYCQETLPLEECKRSILTEQFKYFKRQRTWFEAKNGRGYKLEKVVMDEFVI